MRLLSKEKLSHDETWASNGTAPASTFSHSVMSVHQHLGIRCANTLLSAEQIVFLSRNSLKGRLPMLHTGALTRSQAYDRNKAKLYSSIEQQPGSYVHPVTEALKESPYCNFSGNDVMLTAGKWYKDEDGEYFFEPEMCRIRRYSAEAARSCLSGKHIAFVGDSVTRYEYLSLVHFLSKKQYMERYGASDAGNPSLVNEHDFSSWDDFFARGSARIAAAVDAEADELCDCHRPLGGPLSDITEHREFVLHQHGDALVRVSYHFSYNYPSVEESMLQKLIQLFACGVQHPDVVVLNMVQYLC